MLSGFLIGSHLYLDQFTPISEGRKAKLMRRLLVWLVIAAFVSTSLAEPARSNFVAESAVAAEDARSLPRSTPERQGISSADIFDFVDTADKQIDTMNSFMLVRHGNVVAEGWWALTTRPRHTFS